MHDGGRVGYDGVSRQVPNWLFYNAPRLHEGLRPDEWPVILQQGEEVKSRADVARGRANDTETNSLLRELITTLENKNLSVRNINLYERPQDWAQSAEGETAIMNVVTKNRQALGL
jgi:hypothetical protein